MKIQIRRLSPHQNAKVFAVLMAVGSLVFVLPFMLVAFFASPPGARPPIFFFAWFPVAYLVLGYVSVAAGCWLYNTMFRYVGGVEFETVEAQG